jgi:hypothetical protein
LVLEQRRPGGLAEPVRSDIVWENNRVEWQAQPGEYELRVAPK